MIDSQFTEIQDNRRKTQEHRAGGLLTQFGQYFKMQHSHKGEAICDISEIGEGRSTQTEGCEFDNLQNQLQFQKENEPQNLQGVNAGDNIPKQGSSLKQIGQKIHKSFKRLIQNLPFKSVAVNDTAVKAKNSFMGKQEAFDDV